MHTLLQVFPDSIQDRFSKPGTGFMLADPVQPATKPVGTYLIQRPRMNATPEMSEACIKGVARIPRIGELVTGGLSTFKRPRLVKGDKG
jgi:hypothetical protein